MSRAVNCISQYIIFGIVKVRIISYLFSKIKKEHFLKERKLGTETYNSKDTIFVNCLPECQSGDLLRTFISFFNSILQFEFSPSGIYSKGIVNTTRYPVYLMEPLPPKCRELQLEPKQTGIKTVTDNCEIKVLCPRKESGVSLRPIHAKPELLKLKDVAVLLRNTSTVSNRRYGKRNYIGSTSLSLEKNSHSA